MPSAPLSRSRAQRGVLEDLLGTPAPATAVHPEAPARPQPAAHPAPAAAAPPVRLTVHLRADLIERVRNAVYYTPGLTLSGLASAALRREIDGLEAERGEPFPDTRVTIRTGRPVR
jgi:hypothetical protein